MKLKKYLPPVIFEIYKHYSAKSVRNYKVGDYLLDCPENYGNIDFVSKFKLYDRFLPVLVKFISSEKVIVDVGANIGDTTISIVGRCDNPIVSIEPSDFFYSFLLKNISKLDVNQRSRIKIVKNLVGSGTFGGELHHEDWGTASVKFVSEGDVSQHIPLDKLIDDMTNVALIKVDTDGFDFDVINSAKKILTASQPILYWENQINEDFQKDGYSALYRVLESMGYKYIYIFDNYGNLITVESDFQTLENINSYIFSMEVHECTRTIYYTDILACTELYSTQVEMAIDEYRRNCIKK
jgi:FkbM family methyltransferase